MGVPSEAVVKRSEAWNELVRRGTRTVCAGGGEGDGGGRDVEVLGMQSSISISVVGEVHGEEEVVEYEAEAKPKWESVEVVVVEETDRRLSCADALSLGVLLEMLGMGGVVSMEMGEVGLRRACGCICTGVSRIGSFSSSTCMSCNSSSKSSSSSKS